MKVKICGLTTYEDARQALDLGAWALGFILHRPSPRYIEPAAIARIVSRLPPAALAVGVFVDAPLEDVVATVRLARLRGVQLHGVEPPAYADRVPAELVIKAFRVGESFDLSQLEAYPRQTILLDAYHPSAAGGTGLQVDWSLARAAGGVRPIVLAGGIRPDNVEDCLRLARPDAIDVSSGVELRPGVKDPELVRRLFEAVSRPPAES